MDVSVGLPRFPAASPDCNIELKARLASLDAARAVASSLVDERLTDQHQIDTYFNCNSGRLKLREIVGVRAELIAYERPDQTEAKASHYYVLPVDSPERVIEALSMTLGVRSRVEKHREIYLHKNVRIHLDSVKGLGEFLEFEAVLRLRDGRAESVELVADLTERFGIADEHLVEGSYVDLLAATEE